MVSPGVVFLGNSGSFGAGGWIPEGRVMVRGTVLSPELEEEDDEDGFPLTTAASGVGFRVHRSSSFMQQSNHLS
jgi:hypothetical protein